MYPVEFILILLIVLMLHAIGAAGGNMLERTRLFLAEVSPIRGLLHRCGPWVAALLIVGVGAYGISMIMERDPGTYNNLGRALAARGNQGEAIPFFEQALQHDQENLQAKFNLALAHLKLAHYGEAVPLLREVLRAKPGDADNNYLLGVALARSGMLPEGQKYLQEALRLNPGHEDARKALSMAK
jgi:tetratricopeptide (TPR) repeat protein